MRALSLLQPWASMVAQGAKQYETRGWATSYRGELAIHASKGFPADCQDLCDQEPFAGVIRAAYLCARTLPRGAVLCVVRVLDCRNTYDVARELQRQSGGERELEFGDFSHGRFAWKLELVETFPEPIYAKGAQGLWEWEP